MSKTPEKLVVNMDSNHYWYSLQKLNHALGKMSSESMDDIKELESIITHHKPDLASLLANEPRNPAHREAVTKACKDGIFLVTSDVKSKTIIPEVVVNEALVFSEMFELNEIISLELIIMGSNQEARYPGMTRAPIAVLLYYDAKRVLLSSLKLIVDSISGRTWSSVYSEEVCKVMEKVVNELREADVIYKCLENLENFSVSTEYDKLLINKALGPGKYKKQVYDLIKEIRQLYAEVVFSFSAQSTLSPKELKKLTKIISERSELDSNGCLDQITTTLLMSLLYLMDVSLLQTCEDGDPMVSKLPVSIHRNIFEEIQLSLRELKFSVESLQVIIKFVLIIALKTVSLFPLDGVSPLIGEEDEMLDEVIDKKLFESMNRLLAQNSHVYREHFFLSRIHEIISDFIALFPLKIKELRDKGDEEGRIIAVYMAENLQIPVHIRRNLEKLLYLMAELYSHDTMGLSASLWTGSFEETRLLPKCVAFRKFIRCLIDSPLPQVLHVPVLKLLTSFANVSPFNVYNFLKCTGINQNSQFSFDQFFTTLQCYLSSIIGADKSNLQASQFVAHSQRQLANFASINLSPLELDILCSILNLIESIVKNDRNCCTSIADNQRYSCITTIVGLLMGPVPRKLKAAILSCIGGFANASAPVALAIWIKMDVVLPKSQILTSTFANIRRNMNWQSGIALEIEDIEPRNEEYPITIAFLSAINSLIKHICYNRQPAHQFALFDCTEFIINSILLKCNSRFYKIQEEKWTIKLYSLKILNCILEIFDPVRDVPGLKAAFSVMWQILQENSLFTCVMEVIEDIVTMYGPETGGGVEPSHKNAALFEQCLLNSLKLFNHVAASENEFIRNIHTLPGYPSAMLLNLSTLFSNVNHRTENIDRMATLIKAISLPSIPVQIESLRLLQNLVQSDHQTSQRMLLQMKPFNEYHEDYFIHGFVDCLESQDESLCLEALKFILTSVKRDSAPRLYGFSHRLLGYDRSKTNLRVPSALGQTYNSFHTIMDLIGSEDDHYKKRSLAMEIIYTLCNDPELSESTLRFLRTSYEFPGLLLKRYNLKRAAGIHNWLTKENLSEVAWFWKILAIEVKITADNQLKTTRDFYVQTLLGQNGENVPTELIPEMVFKHQHPEMSKWEFFDANELWKTFSEVTIMPDNVIDVRALHQKLLEEVNTVGSQLGIIQTNMIQTEIQGILQYSMALNASQEQLNSNTLYFESWRSLIETIIACKCLDIFEPTVKTNILIGLVRELLHVASTETVGIMTTPLSSVVLLSVSLLAAAKPDSIVNSQLLNLAKSIISLLESANSINIWNQYKRARVNFYTSLIHLYRMLPSSFSYELKIGSRLLKKICKDILSGHEVTKVLAMSILNESEMTWVRDLSNDGTLKLLIDSLASDDKEILQNKFDVHCKAFYSFDSKMALLMKICSNPAGFRLTMHAGVIDVLASLESFELYPFYINQSDVCHKMFVSTLRLLLCLCTADDGQCFEPFSLFLNLRGSVLCDILRMAGNIKNTPEGINVLTLITGIISRVIFHVNKQLQRSFMSLLNYYFGSIQPTEIKIVVNLLIGYVRIISMNESTPILAPSWNYQEAFANFGSPTLGSLILLIDENVTKCSQNDLYVSLVEPCLYLVWHHLNLFFTSLDVIPEQRSEIAKLKAESNGVASDQFFSKIQNSISTNFVDAMVRRLKRVIKLS